MENQLSIREELAGKTEMDSVIEEDLFRRLEEIDQKGQVVDSLSKKDWIGILLTFVLLGLCPLLYYAIQLA